MLYSHEQLYIHICQCMQNHNDDTIKMSGHSSLEKYTSHFIERVVYEKELETEQGLQHIDPPTLLAITAFLSRSPGLLNRGAQPLLGHVSHSSIFSPTNLNFLSPGSYNNLMPTYFLRASQFALNSTHQQSRSPLISWYLRPNAPVIYTGAFLLLTAQSGSICNTISHLLKIMSTYT